MTLSTMLSWLSWVCFIILTILGAFGYLEQLFGLKWNRHTLIFLLCSYLLLSGGQRLLEWYEDKKAPEEFYGNEITKIFLPGSCSQEMKFFTDTSNNKSVALLLEYEPIVESIHLWEGGYHAPPITLAVSGKEVIFKHSAYTSCEDYRANVPTYQVRYFPKK